MKSIDAYLHVICVLVLCALFLTGCTGYTAAGRTGYAIAPPPSETEPIETFTPVSLPQLDADWQALTGFSREFFRAVLAEEDPNPIVSPLSAYFALAMAALGADGVTAEEFTAVLGYEALELAQQLASLYAHLTRTEGRTVLNLANSVWVNDAYTVIPEFNHTARRYFGAPARARDFSRQSTVDEINAWIREQTEGLIDNVLQEISDGTAMFLINAMYLLARWPSRMGMARLPFHPAVPAGEEAASVTVPFVTQYFGSLPIMITEGFTAALLTYDDRRTAFLLAMPTDSTPLRDFAQSHCMYAILNELQNHDSVTLRMPELDKNFDIDLIDILYGMGLATAFVKFEADFPGLVEENDPPIFISAVDQFARIIVDRYGTEAAVVTVITAEPSSAPPPRDTLYLTFDRPFLYTIFDLPTGIPLFMGAVDNPAR